MRKELFICDLCKEEYSNVQAIKSGMKSYYCTQQYITRHPDVPSHVYELRELNASCHVHICGQCLNNLKTSLPITFGS